MTESEPQLSGNGPPPRVYSVLTSVALAAMGGALFLWGWGLQWQQSILWQDYFEDFLDVGQNCQAAVGRWESSDSFTKILQQPHSFKPLKMPYRGQLEKAKVPQQGYLYTRCQVDFSSLNAQGYAKVNLGPLFGKVAVFLDGEVKLIQEDNRFAAFHVKPGERTEGSTVTVIARRTPDAIWPGPASLFPMIATDDRGLMESIEYLRTTWTGEQQLYRLGFCLALAIIFLVAWVAGIRYPDVGWMGVTILLLGCQAYLTYSPTSDLSLFYWRCINAVGNASLYALCAFLASFFRLRIPHRVVHGVYWGVVGLTTAVCLLIPSTWFYLATTAVPKWLVAGVFAVLSFYAARRMGELPVKRRRYVKAAAGLGLMAAAALTADAAVNLSTGLDVAPFVIYGITTAFAVVMALDLVVFHREFFREKARRFEQEKKALVLEERLELGKAVQTLLLPENTAGRFGQHDYRFYYATAERMGGDWMFEWELEGTEKRLFMGDVVGKGPQAALAVSVIISELSDCRSLGLSVEEAIVRVNHKLLALFNRHISTTLCAVAIPKSGPVGLYNFGTMGFVHLGAQDVSYLGMRSNILGVSEHLAPEGRKVTMEERDVLLTFTDGYLEGSRALHRLIRTLRGAKDPLGPTELEELVRATGRETVFDDDRTMLVLQKKPATGVQGDDISAA